MNREELLSLLAITERWALPAIDNKFYLYKPSPIPEIFHKSHAKVRALFGGNRSGKTHSLMIEYAATFLGKAPKSLEGMIPEYRLDPAWRQRICCIDYPNNFQKVIWEYIKQLIPADSIADIVKDQGRIKSITNHKGGFIEFMQYEQDVAKFQGSSRHRVGYDEEPPRSIRDENNMRLADTNGEEIYSLTPVSAIDKPLLWIYDGIYEKAGRIVEKFDNIISDVSIPEGSSDVHVFFANIHDNRVLDEDAINRILSIYPADERAVREKGHFMFQSGRVYKEYSDNIHLIDDFDWWKRDMTLYVAIDPHPRTPHAVLFMCVDPYGTKYIVDELFIDTDARGLADAIKVQCRGRRPERIIIDPFAYTPDPISKGCLAYSLIDCGLNEPIPTRAPKDLANGIIAVRKSLKPIEGKPEVYVTKCCARFRYEISHYVWDSWKKDTSDKHSEKQKPLDKNDHMMENLYRLILIAPQHIEMDEYEDDLFTQKRNQMRPNERYY